MPTKRVLDVGNCDMDHGNLRRLIEGSFDAKLVRCHTQGEALDALRAAGASLVLINRQLDHDLTEGIDVIRAIKGDPDLAATPCLMLTNFPEFRQAAMEVGGEPGFGKRDLFHPDTRVLLARYLG